MIARRNSHPMPFVAHCMRLLSSFWMLSLILMLFGCSSVSERVDRLIAPKVELAHVVLQKADLLSPRFLLSLRVENLNADDIQVEGADAVLSLNGKPVAKGVSPEPVILKGRQETEVEIEATAKTLALARQIFRLDTEGRIAFSIDGHLTLAQWLGIPATLPFRVSGTMTREELLREIEGFSHQR